MSRSARPLPDAATLYQWYVVEQQPVAAIAKRAGCQKVRITAALEAAGIPRRPAGHIPAPLQLPDVATLHQWYVVEQRSVAAIAKQAGCHKTRIIAALEAAGIPRRPAGHIPAPLPSVIDPAEIAGFVQQFGRTDVRKDLQRFGLRPHMIRRLIGSHTRRQGQSIYRRVDADAVRQAHAAGEGVVAIARRLGCHRNSVWLILAQTPHDQQERNH